MDVSWDIVKEWLGKELVQWATPNSPVFIPAKLGTDSRNLKKGDFFVPIKGEKFDGHGFISDALKKGAVGFFYEAGSAHKISDKTLGIEVKSTLSALQAVAKGWMLKVGLEKVIALTGSVGKTTTKEMLRAILSAQGPSIVSEGSFNNELGVPLTMLRLTEDLKFAAFEFGARHKGDIKFLTELVRPSICVCLNASNAHLEIFQTADNVLSTKTEILRDSPRNAILVANHDDERIMKEARACGKELKTFGKNKEATVCIENSEWTPSGGMAIHLKVFGEMHQFELSQAHESFPVNVAAATTAALAAGIDLEAIKKAMSTFAGIQGRFQTFKQGPLTIIDDTYNANPDSMSAGIRTCAKLYPKQKKIAVLGDMLELGKDSEKFHLAIGAMCQNEMKPDLLMTVGKESLKIAEGAVKAGLAKDKLLSFSTVDEAMRLPTRIYQKREVIFVKGSHGIQLNKLIKILRGQS